MGFTEYTKADKKYFGSVGFEDIYCSHREYLFGIR